MAQNLPPPPEPGSPPPTQPQAGSTWFYAGIVSAAVGIVVELLAAQGIMLSGALTGNLETIAIFACGAVAGWWKSKKNKQQSELFEAHRQEELARVLADAVRQALAQQGQQPPPAPPAPPAPSAPYHGGAHDPPPQSGYTAKYRRRDYQVRDERSPPYASRDGPTIT